jgi:diguanylate cyclase (GGDEF)-like protein/PAS domain S-box-containing protein
MSGGITTTPIRSTLAGLVAALLILSAAAELAFQALVAIPRQVVAQQSETARLILARQSQSVARALDTGQLVQAEPALQGESSNPDLRWLALVDAQGRVALATPPAWRDQMAHRTIEGLVDLGSASHASSSPWIHVDLTGDTLTAVLPVAFPAGTPQEPAAPNHQAPQTHEAVSHPSPRGSLYLALDLRRLRAAAWAQRLAPAGWLPWAIGTGIAILLMTHLAENRLRRPLRQIQTLVGSSANGEGVSEPLIRGHGEIADLAADLEHMGQRIQTLETERRTQTLRWGFALDGAAEGIWDWDLTSDRTFYSPRCRTLLGLGSDASDDRLDAWLVRVHPDDLSAWHAAMERHQDGASPDFVCEHRLRTQDGTWRWVVARGRTMERGAQGQPLRIIGTLADITDRKLTERSLAYLVNLETVLLEASRALSAAQPEAVDAVVDRILGAVARRMDVEHACVFTLGTEGRELRATHSWGLVEGPCQLADASPMPEEQLPRWMETLRHGEDIRIGDVSELPEAWSRDRQVLTQIGVRAVASAPLRTGERLGGFVAVEVESGPRDWRESELRALRLLGDLFGAAFERRKFELEIMESRQRLDEIALYDILTGLPNRRLLGERMQEAMAAAVEGGTQLAICYLDLDGFKPINDHYGRGIGDQILIAVADRLREQVRESDTVARLGGDEFVLLMGGFDSLIECANALDRLVKTLAQPHLIEGEELRVTASVGAILYPRDSHDADTLLRHADHAMYQAKQRGRNRVRFFDTVRDRRAHARRSQLERIGEAIEDGELRLYYQPKVDMRRGKVVGAEGLVRWQHPTKGLLPPGAFIPLLDGTELQQRLDWWVIGAGLEQLEIWHTQGLDLGLSLNISARSVQHEGFVAELRSRLEQHRGLTPHALSLEILESEALGDLDAVANVMERCDDLGVRFALDDFGTGYSSLTYFRRLPAQVLKIDQTFVRDMLRSKDDRNIVEGVVGLARAFQREVIAEGVESAAHGLMLLNMGCDRAQGFGVAEPMPPDQLPSWIGRYVSPLLWSLSPRFDWSSGNILDLLTMESVHRDWVARLLRAAAGGSGARPPELAESKCGFGRWYYGEGRLGFGDLSIFQELEGLHDAVHAQARNLLRAQDLGLPGAEVVRSLIEARDRFVLGLHRLQQQVLSDLG